jgi:capsular polysaccharide biosynthesis protein
LPTAVGRLSAQTYSDVDVMPLLVSPTMPNPFGAAAYDAAGRIEDIAIRAYAETRFPPRQPGRRRLPGRFIYGGVLFNHYGHFLIDTLCRFWYLRGHDDLAIWHRRPQNPIEPWQEQLFTMLGIHVEPWLVIDEPAHVDELVIPMRGAEVPWLMTDEQAAALAVYPFGPPRGKRLWLSRSRLPEGRVEGEAELEQRLVAEGWSVMHPEAEPVRAQLERMADASVIGGFDGAAFHTLLLGRDIHARVAIVTRDPDTQRSGIASGMYPRIAAVKGLDQVVIHAGLSHVLGEGRAAVFRLTDPDALLRDLDRVGVPGD